MIQRVGVNTRVQRQNTSNNKSQNFKMAIPKQQMTEAVAKHDGNALNGYIRAIQNHKFHTNHDEVVDGSKFLTERLEASKQTTDKDSIRIWDGLKRAFDNTSARLGFSQ